MRPGLWTKMDRASFEREVESRMKEVEERARRASRGGLRLVPFARRLRLLPAWAEQLFPVPRGPVYGFEAFAPAPEGDVPLGAMVIVGIYDERSGEGVLVDDEWVDAQLREAEELLALARGSS